MSTLFNDPRSKKLLISLLLILSTLLIYRPVKDYWFINYDDTMYVTFNGRVQSGLSWKNIIWSFTNVSASDNWHPLTWLSHMLDCQLYGLNATGHHFMSLSIHLANVTILFLLLNYLTGAFWRSAFVAALFALHPLNVQSVAWIAERKNVLSTMFWLLTMWTYARYVREGGWKRYLLVILTFVLGLMSKPMVVTLPFVLLLMDYWPLNRLELLNGEHQVAPSETNQITGQTSQVSAAPTFISRVAPFLKLGGRLILEKVPLFLLAFLTSSITYIAQHSGDTMLMGKNLPFFIRLVNAIIVYGKYTYKMIYPTRLAFFYPYPASFSLPLATLLALLIIAISVISWRSKKKYLFFGWFWFIGTLIPVIGLIQVGGQEMADRYTYVPLIGLFILITWLAVDISKRLAYQQQLLTVMGISILLALALCTRHQLSYWRDSATLMSHAISVTSNNYIAYNNLGNAYMDIGDTEEALKNFNLSIENSPLFLLAHFNRGVALLTLDREDEALASFNFVLAVGLDREVAAKVHARLGEMAAMKGRKVEAASHYIAAIENNRTNASAHFLYGLLLIDDGRYDEAISQLNEAIELIPDPIGYLKLGSAFEARSRLREAREAYREALKLDPTNQQAKENLARISNNISQAG